MRHADTELFKDKIEVSLDGKQVFYLFFGGAIIASLVFVLGVMVGKRVEARAHVAVQPDTSAARDPLAALDALSADKTPALSFPSVLAGDDAPLAPIDEALAARPAPVPDNDERKDDRPKPAPAAKHDPAKIDRPDVVHEPDAKPAVPKPAAAKPKPAKPAVAKPEPAGGAVKLAAAAVNGGSADDDGDDAGGDDPDDADPGESDAAAEPKFTLQLSSFQNRAEADSFYDTLVAAGYAPYIVEAEVDGKGTFYRVRLGRYRSYQAAIDAKLAFESKQNVIAYVTRLKKRS